MKKYYVVLENDGYYLAKDKKDAIRYLHATERATHIIHTQSALGNFYHNRIKTIREK